MRAVHDFQWNPFLVIWETTRSCALRCVHCRAEAIDRRDPGELSTAEAHSLLEEIRRFGTPLVVLTGGDPLRRPDLLDLVRYAKRLGLRIAVTPSGTEEVTPQIVKRLSDAGLDRLAVSLDGPDAETHDEFRQVAGSFDATTRIIRWAVHEGLEVQVNTTVAARTAGSLDRLYEFLQPMGIRMWSVFFLVQVGRGRGEAYVGGLECERIFHRLVDWYSEGIFDIKSTEAPQFRRVLLQRKALLPGAAGRLGRAPLGINDGKGFVFISHTGEVYPSGFLPVSAGNVKQDPLTDLYRHSPMFRTIRDESKLKGKCGACEFKTVCGGSRSRAYASSGDWMGADPLCTYVPAGYEVSEEEKACWT